MDIARAPELSDRQKQIYREMDPLFLHFYATVKTLAICSSKIACVLYGDDPDDIDHCVMVMAMPNGGVGLNVHPEGNHAVQMDYVRSLIGPTYFAMTEGFIMRGFEELTPDNIDEVLDRFKTQLKKLADICDDCKDDAEQQTELPLWVKNIVPQEEKTDA